MSTWQKTKLVGPLLLFNILLPTWDVFSDFKLSVNLYIGGSQNCSIEEENVQAFRQELDSCLVNPQEYCQSDSIASYLCPDEWGLTHTGRRKCMFCEKTDCDNPDYGISEIYFQCLNNEYFDNNGSYHKYLKFDSKYYKFNYCSDPYTYHGICETVTRSHYIFAIMLLGIL